MTFFKSAVLLGAAVSLSACTVGPDKTRDRGFDAKHLSQLVAGVWVDPNGCDHWIIDDGVEGYLSPRLQPDGAPVCSNVAPPGTAVGPFKSGSRFGDIL
ncbi:MAG: hypothetical protein ACU0B7_13560 [Paracoccaceae bacterium]|uniref:hypothetical protein n=1 Tax=Seohaeicola saemankumensis TaxID=481181 RepID=UPI001E52F878|nr:hypothetical protein [Seohaeicola saemankumensis]MCD1627471.1 hypothetical protein [Seohaeicola saemankumensis]